MKNLIIISIVFTLLFGSGCCELFDNCPVPPENVGDTLWIHNVPNLNKTTFLNNMPFAIGKDGSLYYVASGDQVTWAPSRVYAVNKDDGTLKWMTEPLAIWHTNSNIVVGDDGTIYILSYYFLYSIDPQTGKFNWIWEVPKTIIIDGAEKNSYGEVGALALCNNGDLVFKTCGSGSYYRAMYCVDKNKNTRWIRPIPHNGLPISVGNTGIIFDYEYFENKEYLFAINPDDGNTLWNYKLDFYAAGTNNITIGNSTGDIISVSNECVIDTKGNFYRASGDGIFEFDNEGTRIDTFLFNVGSYGRNIVLSKDNILYSAGADKKIIAIQIKNPIATKGWPCFTHDNRNTFNYSKRNN